MLKIKLRAKSRKAKKSTKRPAKRTTKKATRRPTGKNKKAEQHKGQEHILGAALRQIESELGKMSVTKRKLENHLFDYKKNIKTIHATENELQLQLNELSEREITLKTKRDQTAEKLNTLREKITKLIRVEDDIKQA